MVLIFHFKDEQLGIKSLREFKENAIPALFDHAPLPQKGRLSIERMQNQTNRLLRKLKETYIVFQQQPPTIWEFIKLIRPLITLLKWSLPAHSTVLVILSKNRWFHQKSQWLF